MRVRDELLIAIKTCHEWDDCATCQYLNKPCRVPSDMEYQLAADLLEARAMIREMRKGYDIIMSNTLNPAKTMTKLGLELTQEGNRTIAKRMIEKSKEFVDE